MVVVVVVVAVVVVVVVAVVVAVVVVVVVLVLVSVAAACVALVCETYSAHVDHFHTMQVSLRKRDSAAALAFATLTSPLKIRDMSWHHTNWLNLLRSSGANPQGCLAATNASKVQTGHGKHVQHVTALLATVPVHMTSQPCRGCLGNQ